MSLFTFDNSTMDVSIARAQAGEVYFHNGDSTDRPRRWKGTGSATYSGITGPTGALSAAGSGSGSLNGIYTVYYRYVDADGVPSNFSSATEVTLSSASSISYTSITVATETRPSNTQIWRNTAGQNITYYLDATVAVAETTASSTNTDDQLRASEALRFLTEDGFPNANRFTPPPADMAIVVSFQDRMWFTCSTSDANRNTIMFSEAGEPESVPTCNSLILQEDGDDIVGLMPCGAYLYVLKRRHIYRLGTAGDPRKDAACQLVAERGCLNNHCWCRVEGVAILLDENGLYVFDGNGVEPIDTPIRDYLLTRVNWDAEDTFSVAKSPDEEVIKVLVALDTDTSPKHALCYQYRLKAWSLETHAAAMGCATEAVVDGMSRLVVRVGNDIVLMDVDAQDDNTNAFAYSAKFGEFRLLPLDQDNPRRVTIWFTPVSNEELVCKLYFNGSATASTVDITMDNENGVTTVAGSSEYTIDLSNAEGFASFRFDGGMDRDAQVHRTVSLELSGSAWHEIIIHRIEIDGVRL